MKVAILAGGLGTRLSEETSVRPKPMVEIGGRPMLWHIMSIYAAQGFREFVVALGYKGEMIKDYFLGYHLRASSLTVELSSGRATVHGPHDDDWVVHLLDTGDKTNTGGRIKQVAQFIGDEPFMLTYGDGVADIDLKALNEFHQAHGKLATVTAVRPPARFGGIVFEGDRVHSFAEKPQVGEGWVNGGFFVLQPGIADYIADDQILWEKEPMERLAEEGELFAYRHESFWHSMDTMRDVYDLERMWASGKPPWKVW